MKIPPLYQVTPEIIDLIAKIEANRMFLNSTEMIPELKSKIQRVSLLKSSLFSARIEGNPLSLLDFEHSPDKLKKKEIANIIKTINYIDLHLKPNKEMNVELVKHLHSLVMQDLSPDAGKFRTDASAIFNTSGIAVYVPPPPSLINGQISELLSYISNSTEKYPLIIAFITHLVFEKIHPFLDGNGRVGRLLIFSVLKIKNWSFPLSVPVEEYYDEHKDAYYYHLDVGLNEPEAYLEFMLNAFYIQIEKIKDDLKKETAKDYQIFLPPRQEEIFSIIKDHKMISLDFLKRRFLKVPERTLRYDLKKLADKNLVLKIGNTKGSFYRVKK